MPPKENIMREFKFKRILLSDERIQSPDENLGRVFTKAFGDGIVVMRRETWRHLREFLKKVTPFSTFKKTRFVVINERDGKEVVWDKDYDGRIGITHSEYNLLMPEIQQRAFGPDWTEDGEAQNVIFIEGNSPQTNFQHAYEDYLYCPIQVESIYSVTTRGYIGKDNELMAPIPEDFVHFQKQTRGQVLVMGFKTWEGVPYKNKFVLGNEPAHLRKIALIVDRPLHPAALDSWAITPEAASNIAIVTRPEPKDLIQAIKDGFDDQSIFNNRKLMICGGAKIYDAYASLVERIHETLVILPEEGDTKLPASVREGFQYLPGDPTFRTSKNGHVYRISQLLRMN